MRTRRTTASSLRSNVPRRSQKKIILTISATKSECICQIQERNLMVLTYTSPPSSIDRGARSGIMQGISRTFLSIFVTTNPAMHWSTLSCRRLRTLFIIWTPSTRRTKERVVKERRNTPRCSTDCYQAMHSPLFTLPTDGSLVFQDKSPKVRYTSAAPRWSVLIGGA